MGSKLVSDLIPLNEGDRTNEPIPFSFTTEFQKHLPYYLAIGMTYDQYYNDDCLLAKYYREAHNLKRKMKNQEMWMQGMYIYEAISSFVPVLVTIPDKNAKVTPYRSEPYPLSQKEAKEMKEAKEKAEFMKMKESLIAWANGVNVKKGG